MLIRGKKAEQQIKLALLEPCGGVNQAQVWFTQRSGCLTKLGRETKGSMRLNQRLQEIRFSLPSSLHPLFTWDEWSWDGNYALSLTHISLHPMIQPEREHKNFAKNDKRSYSIRMCTRFLHLCINKIFKWVGLWFMFKTKFLWFVRKLHRQL